MPLKLDVRILDEPTLEFGPNGEHVDPRVGLREFGPLTLRFGAAHPEHIRVGLVGPLPILDNAHQWFDRCRNFIASEAENQSLYPDYPGFKQVFRSNLDLEPSIWDIEIKPHDLESALNSEGSQKRFNGVLELYFDAFKDLAGRNLKPDVVVICLPDDVLKRCRSVRAQELTSREKRLVETQLAGQMVLPGLEEQVVIDDTLLYRDFRRALKARAMDVGLPIQIGTNRLFIDTNDTQDPATRAWNVSLALFYKAGGLPWRLSKLRADTCYIGISFHHLRTRHHHTVFSSLAQAFPTSGEGFALRGDIIPPREKKDRQLHLSEDQAAHLAKKVIDQYRHRIGSDPLQVVFYKTTSFDAGEQAGLRAALEHIPVVEMVNLKPSDFRLVRRGAYPPYRGTLVTINENTHYLFTNGYYSDWGTYMGAHVPVPYEIEIPSHYDPESVSIEVLRLTKLNWNSARAFSSVPITLCFAREVGSIMSHYAELRGEDAMPKPDYRFYM